MIVAIIYQFTSYSKYLAAELERRKLDNHLYSLRAMAKQLEISPATLSDVMKGKKKLSEDTAAKVSKKLKISGGETRYFQTLVSYENSHDENLKKILENQLKVLNPEISKKSELPDDNFIILSEWHHIAILELTYLFPKKLNSKIVSNQLNISLNEAGSALSLLEKLNLIEKNGQSYKKTKKQFKFKSQLANQALRQFHNSMLLKAQTAIMEQTNSEKFVGSETIPLNIEDLEEAKNILENCFQQILRLSEEKKEKTHVYHLGIQLFQLNRPKLDRTEDFND